MESALVSHPKVAEAAVAPMPHEIKGQALYAGAESPFSLYSEDLASFVMGKSYNPRDATGFIHLFGLPMKVRGLMERKTKQASQGSAKRRKK